MDPQGQGEASPVKNFTGGGGCGCGCLGMLIMVGGGLILLGVPLEFYDPDALRTPVLGGIAVLAAGGLMVLLGTVAYIGSLLLD